LRAPLRHARYALSFDSAGCAALYASVPRHNASAAAVYAIFSPRDYAYSPRAIIFFDADACRCRHQHTLRLLLPIFCQADPQTARWAIRRIRHDLDYCHAFRYADCRHAFATTRRRYCFVVAALMLYAADTSSYAAAAGDSAFRRLR